MSATPPPAGLTEPDFERIEAAVLETERGRWFLGEYARRIRAEETKALAAALARIENKLEADGAAAALRRNHAEALADLRERLFDLALRLGEAGSDAAAAALRDEILYVEAFFDARAPRARLIDDRHVSPALRDRGVISLRLQAIGAIDEPASGAQAIAESFKMDEEARIAAFAAIDALPVERKLAFFG